LHAVEPSRRPSLIAQPVTTNAFRFDIRLRGGDETPFFDD
jgi:protocatechuate 3,4-dioxygenase beta subunit